MCSISVESLKSLKLYSWGLATMKIGILLRYHMSQCFTADLIILLLPEVYTYLNFLGTIP